MNALGHLPRFLAVALVFCALLMNGGRSRAEEAAGTGANTMTIAAATVQALPSCLAYQVTGVCFFLKCYVYYCEIETSIRVQHYMPDVVVSTYNAPDQHPWTDLGKPIAQALAKAGEGFMASVLDSQATTARETKEVVTFKSADAIGNPIGAFLGGNNNWEYPDTNELTNFPSQELPKIAQQWAQVPTDLGNNILEGARAQALNPSQMLGQITSIPGQFSSLFGSFTSLGSMGGSNPMDGAQPSQGGSGSGTGTGTGGGTGTGSGSGSGTGTGTGTGSGSGGGTGSGSGSNGYSQILDQMYAALGDSGASGGSSGGSAGMSSYICPGGSGMLSIQYHSDIDSPFWRGKYPLDLLYPGSWVPGIGEVGNSLINTWGNTYPRHGELVQSHPVKSSAVISSRVASIIRQAAQPHIYKKLYPKGESDYVYFKTGVSPMWQAVHPVPDTGCITFGSNDSLSLGSYGDYKTSGNEGYIWNLWQLYECCERVTPIFLFAVP